MKKEVNAMCESVRVCCIDADVTTVVQGATFVRYACCSALIYLSTVHAHDNRTCAPDRAYR